jgi:hypothetical protein
MIALESKQQLQISLFNEIVAGKYRHLLSNKEISNKFKMTIAKMQVHLQSLDKVYGQRAILHVESSVSCLQKFKAVYSNPVSLGYQIFNRCLKVRHRFTKRFFR